MKKKIDQVDRHGHRYQAVTKPALPAGYATWRELLADRFPSVYAIYKDRPVSFHMIAEKICKLNYNAYQRSVACEDMQPLYIDNGGNLR